MSNGEVRITDPVTGGEKGQKPERFDLIPFDALEEVARVYGVGAQKYSDDNWLKGYAWRLSAGALLRHVARFMIGEDRDPETGCLHLAHAAWHCLTLLTFAMRGLGTDDRAVDEDKDDGPVTERHPFNVTPKRWAELKEKKYPEWGASSAWQMDFEEFSSEELDEPIPYVGLAEVDDEEDIWPPKCGAV